MHVWAFLIIFSADVGCQETESVGVVGVVFLIYRAQYFCCWYCCRMLFTPKYDHLFCFVFFLSSVPYCSFSIKVEFIRCFASIHLNQTYSVWNWILTFAWSFNILFLMSSFYVRVRVCVCVLLFVCSILIPELFVPSCICVCMCVCVSLYSVRAEISRKITSPKKFLFAVRAKQCNLFWSFHIGNDLKTRSCCQYQLSDTTSRYHICSDFIRNFFFSFHFWYVDGSRIVVQVVKFFVVANNVWCFFINFVRGFLLVCNE